ncbi:hypothetical protein ACA910_001102 [Epithemia clementina (nom. ined.)]
MDEAPLSQSSSSSVGTTAADSWNSYNSRTLQNEPDEKTPSLAPVAAKPSAFTAYPTFESTTKPTATSNKSSTPRGVVNEGDSIVVEKFALIRILSSEGKQIPLSSLEKNWQNYLQNTLLAVYRNSQQARLKEVLMKIDGQLLSRRQKRNLQQGSSATTAGSTGITGNIQANVRVEFVSRQNNLTIANFTSQAETLVKNYLAPANLQQSMATAPSQDFDTFTILSTTFPKDANSTTDNTDDNNSGPSVVRLVAGFTLLGFVLLSLLFWLQVYLKYREKKAEDRKRTKARKNQTYILPRPHHQHSHRSPNRSPHSKSSAPILYPADFVPSPASSNTSSNQQHPYYRGEVGGGRGDRHSHSPTTADDDDYDDVSDPFAQELEHAASADEQAWEAFQRKKEQMKKDGRLVTSLYPSILGGTSTTATSVGSTRSSGGGEGIEVMPGSPGGSTTLTFPYGDDNDEDTSLIDTLSLPGTQLTALAAPSSIRKSRRPPTASLVMGHNRKLSNATFDKSVIDDEETTNQSSWSLRSSSSNNNNNNPTTNRKRVSFEPYGEPTTSASGIGAGLTTIASTRGGGGGVSISSRASVDSSEPLSPNTADETTVEQPSTDAVRSTTSSWTGASIVSRDEDDDDASSASAMSQLANLTASRIAVESDDEDDDATNNENDRSTSFDMMKEVAQLSEYVKKYQEKKQKDVRSSTATSSRRLSVLSENNLVRGDHQTYHSSARPAAVDSSSSPANVFSASAQQQQQSRRRPWRHDSSSTSASTRYYLSAMQRLEAEAAELSSRIESNNSSSDLSTGEADTPKSREQQQQDEEDSSLRLGIQRFKKQEKPPTAPTFGPVKVGGGGTKDLSTGGEPLSPGSIRHSGSSSMGRVTTSSPDTPPSSVNGAAGADNSHNQNSSSWRPHSRQAVRNILRPPGSTNTVITSAKTSKLRALRSSNLNMLDGNKEESEGDLESQSESTSSVASQPQQDNGSFKARGSATGSFANIVNMFESRPKTPISPPRPDWETSSSNSGSMTGRRPSASQYYNYRSNTGS